MVLELRNQHLMPWAAQFLDRYPKQQQTSKNGQNNKLGDSCDRRLTFDKYSAAASSPDFSFEISTKAFKAAIGSAIFNKSLKNLNFIWQVIKELPAYISGDSIIWNQYFRILVWPSVKLIVLFFSNRIISIVGQPL